MKTSLNQPITYGFRWSHHIFIYLVIGSMLFFDLIHVVAGEVKELRMGHFPNLTHGQALYGRALGDFEKAVDVPIHWSSFNAGPSVIEALFAGAIDIAYIGPNPAVNGYIKSRGKSLRIIAGSTGGGAALVVRNDSGILTEKDFHNKTIATPQLGNTQDVAARIWFESNGYKLKEKGGDLALLPIANAEQLLLFEKKQIDAAWTVEPWVSLLAAQNGHIFLDEKSLWPEGRYATVLLIVNKTFLEAHPDLVKKVLRVHVEITQKINSDKKAIATILNQELKRQRGRELPEQIVHQALDRLVFTWDPMDFSLKKSAEDAHRIGFLREKPDLSNIYDLTLLNEVLKEKGLPEAH